MDGDPYRLIAVSRGVYLVFLFCLQTTEELLFLIGAVKVFPIFHIIVSMHVCLEIRVFTCCF